MNWHLGALKKYAMFGGRSRRKDYWMFFLFNVIICLRWAGSKQSLALTRKACLTLSVF